MKKWFVFPILVLFLACSNQAFAANARDYVPLPAGTSLIDVYYSHSFGNEYYSDYNKKSDKANLTGNIGILRPMHYTEVGPFIMVPQFILPFGGLQLSNDMSQGIGDLILGNCIFLVHKEDIFLAFHPFLKLPTGQYRKNSPINLGANRWSGKGELAMGKRFGENFWLEWINSVEFFSDNNDAAGLNNRSVTSSQHPLFVSEVHASYTITKDLVGSVDYYFHGGGETSLGSKWQNDWKDTHTIGASLFYMLTNNMQLMLDYQQDLVVRSGVKTGTFTTRIAYLF